MKTFGRIIAIGVGIVILVPLGYIIYGFVTYKSESVFSGEAYGFSIGESHEETFSRALKLKKAGKIAEIHRWPEGSFHYEFSEPDLSDAINDNRWIMIVDPDWWNNSIRLEFQNSELVKIHRGRLCCELP